MSVVVVGAGIVGASVAYHLARTGTPVTVIDGASSPAAGATGKSFAWIGDSGGEWPGGAEDLRSSVRADYDRLAAETPDLPLRWTGSITWADNLSRRPDFDRLGQGQRWIDRRQITELEPNLRAAPERALYSAADGAVDPVAMTRTLVRSARELGARVVLGSAVTSMTSNGGRIDGVLSSGEYHAASIVILAAGTSVAALSGQIGVSLPVVASPAFLMRVAAPPGLVRTLIATPDFEARELRHGQLLVTAPNDAGDSSPAHLDRLAAHTLERLRATFSNSDDLRLLDRSLVERPMPENGPLIGYLTPDRSVYVAVTHSAMTLAPTIGRLVAQELTSGTTPTELRRCRP